MEIRSLKYFLTVAEEGNITRAAEKLCMAQPPLSRQIKLLEEELGVKLFIRGKRQTRLTEQGRFLKQQAEEIIFLLEKTEQQLGKMSGPLQGVVSIGTTETSGAGILSDMLEQFHREAPDVRFRIWSGNGDETRDRLEKNLVDAAIVREPFNLENYDSVFLKSEPWIAVFGRKYPLELTGKGIELSRLEQEPLFIPIREPVQNEINNWFNESATERHIFCWYNALTSVIGLVEKNLGIAICPESAKSFLDSRKLVCRKIINPEHTSGLLLLKKRFQVMPAAAENFWEFARSFRA